MNCGIHFFGVVSYIDSRGMKRLVDGVQISCLGELRFLEYDKKSETTRSRCCRFLVMQVGNRNAWMIWLPRLCQETSTMMLFRRFLLKNYFSKINNHQAHHLSTLKQLVKSLTTKSSMTKSPLAKILRPTHRQRNHLRSPTTSGPRSTLQRPPTPPMNHTPISEEHTP
ncbi:27b59d80-dd94-4f0f-bb18-d69035a93114 [Sclerotinia trifoliorum]|uniref:27b59d80-dd94-4f0f-bb18-d69035a93114 n=1 Tax=Sclerotinia trifoliorum TaxID=28548 RepID=A0A8H2VYX8_9HELO|nr:27b59d80-dd94-4f0f-bb18-d69035a93114 [Sclerotinia trifoliorum]